jgi:hypothetical protein
MARPVKSRRTLWVVPSVVLVVMLIALAANWDFLTAFANGDVTFCHTSGVGYDPHMMEC